MEKIFSGKPRPEGGYLKMEIKIDDDRLRREELVGHEGKDSFIRIPIKFENWKDSRIKHYRIDKLEIIDDKDPPEQKKNIWERLWESIKKIWTQDNGNSSNGIRYRTPEKSEKEEPTPSEEEEKTTKVVKHEDLWCKAIVKDKKIFKKTAEHKKYKMDLALLPESGGEIKREIIFGVESEPKKIPEAKMQRPYEYRFLYINLLLFTITFIGLSLWNLFLNHDAYSQPFFFKDSWIGTGIGLLMGYFGFSIAIFIGKLLWRKSDSLPLLKFPELYFENDFVKKLKKKRNFVILSVAFVLAAFLIIFFRPISLPALPLEYLSYYDCETDQEVEHSGVYRWNFSKIRMGLNKKQRKTKQPFYVAGLKYDKKNDLIPDYYEFIIYDNQIGESTTFSFEEIVDGKELEEERKHVCDYICGKKLSDDSIQVKYDGGKKFTVISVGYLTQLQLKKRLKKFSKTISTKEFHSNTFITERDKTLCKYKKSFIDSIGTKTVRAKELLEIIEFYTKKMDTSFENDMKQMALIWCQHHTAVGFNIKFTSRQIERILEIFESYYHKNNIKDISKIDGRLTKFYLRLLLYIEKNFAEGAYGKIHDSISRVLDSSGGEYYLYYLEESVRNNVLFEPYVDASVVSLREAFFNKKREIFRKLRIAKTKLKEIYNLKEADERSKAFINNLIEGLTPKPAVSPTKEEEDPENLEEERPEMGTRSGYLFVKLCHFLTRCFLTGL